MKKTILLILIPIIVLIALGYLQYNVGITRIDDEIKARILVYNNKETEIDMNIVDELLNINIMSANITPTTVVRTANAKSGRIYSVFSGGFSDGPSSFYDYKGNFIASCQYSSAKRLRLPICDSGLITFGDKNAEYFESVGYKKYVCMIRKLQGRPDSPDSPECLEVLDIEN